MHRTFIVTVEDIENLQKPGIRIVNSSTNGVYHEIEVEPHHSSIRAAIKSVETDPALTIPEFLYGLDCIWLYETTFVKQSEQLIIPDDYQELLELKKRLLSKLLLLRATHEKLADNKRRGELEKKCIYPLKIKIQLVNTAIKEQNIKFQIANRSTARRKKATYIKNLLKDLSYSDYPVSGDSEEKMLWIIAQWGETVRLLHSVLLNEPYTQQEIDLIKTDYNKIRSLAKRKAILSSVGNISNTDKDCISINSPDGVEFNGGDCASDGYFY